MSSVSSQGTIYLRHDQCKDYIGLFENADVGVYAPLWVKGGLEILGKELDNMTFNIYDHKRPENVIESINLVRDTFGLKELQKVARNEEMNVTGKYKPFMYEPLGSKYGVIVALKVEANIWAKSGHTLRYSVNFDSTKYLQFFSQFSHKQQPNTKVIICDLAALQFQQFHNTGRFVLTQKHETMKGMLDEFIFENVVGEQKRKYEVIVEYVKNDTKGRYITTRCFSQHNCFFDVFAYKRFIASDLILCGLAVVHIASRTGDKINFKFLKYGSGFFAGELSEIINNNVLSGVVMGLEELFEKYGDIVKGVVKHVELPFYKNDEESLKKLKEIKKKYGLEYSFSMDDALKQTKKNLVTATTNCGDSSVVFGNEMDFGSVDATIAENLKRKGNTFSTILNKSIKEYFVKSDGTIVNCDDCKIDSMSSVL